MEYTGKFFQVGGIKSKRLWQSVLAVAYFANITDNGWLVAANCSKRARTAEGARHSKMYGVIRMAATVAFIHPFVYYYYFLGGLV